MEAGKNADVYGMIEGHDVQISDAQQAYIQSGYKGIPKSNLLFCKL